MVTDTLIRPPRTIREVFLQLPEGTLAQLIDNNIVMSPSPKFIHQRILNDLILQLGSFIRENQLGQTLIAPMDVYLEERNIFQPDILFISNENRQIIEEDGLHGAPDLIIEILSPGTAKYDLTMKKDVYERCGVKEYWIVDPEKKSAQGYYLEDNRFHEIEGNGPAIQSKLLNTTFELEN